MDEKTENALVPKPPSAVEKVAPGAKRILYGMVTDTLALANREQRIPSPAKFRIGDYEWCEPDYHQILIWAKETGLKPEEVVARLLDQRSLCKESEYGLPKHSPVFEEPLFANGKLLKVNLDLELLRCRKLEWVNGLETTSLRVMPAAEEAWLSELGPLPLGWLEWLICRRLGLTHLNLTRVPQLKYLDCAINQLKELQLHCVPQLTWLNCSENGIAELKFDQIPNLNSLDCWSNILARLDLSGLDWLKFAYCGDNKLAQLKLADLPNLIHLYCRENCLRELDLAEVPELSSLDCSSNQITWLDLSSVHELTDLNCANNAISELDLSSCQNLEHVDCSGNPILVLDIRGLKHLRWLNRSSHTKVIMDPEQEHAVEGDLGPSLHDAKAARLEEIDAHHGWPTEQVRFGLAYLYGRGVPKDAIEAYKWFRLAAEQGDKDAAEELARLTPTLPSDELQEGERRYREFKASR